MITLRLAAAAGIASAVAGLSAGYWRGSQSEHNRHVAREAEIAGRIDAAREKLIARLNDVSGELAEAQGAQSAESREIIRESIRIVDRPVYRSVCVDVDGGRLLDRAVAAANRSLAGEPARATAGAAPDAAQR